ncbi:Uncharacterised protein [Bacteroides heparinolyticus]|uniref:Fimbrillin family protein n=1 Tax=Prevotella heparinolytica TaxID=28113 RepID=A0A449I7I6_9BACE|nr:fimbrillin family protein [Bacteroides heparinolyticus]VFB15370.1 Uncharacterised protein [Bacteroides heparinolyticus]
MKKNVLFLAAGLLAFASCSQDETTGLDNGGAIRFRPNVGSVTRGPILTTGNIASFKVSASIAAAPANFFTDLQVNKAGSQWNTAQTYYWPGTGTLRFFAYSPVDVATVSITPGTQAINNFSPVQAVANQKDVVVAYNTGTKAANEASGVALTFKHILSQIEVKAEIDASAVASYEIKVLGAKLGRIPSTANFTFPTSVATGTLPQTQWSAAATPADYGTKLDTEVTLDGSAKKVTKDNFLMIPQQLTAWTGGNTADGAYIAVLCQISSKSGGNTTQIFPKVSGKYAYAAVPVSTNWLPGKKYTYKLKFLGSGGAGEVDPNQTNPDDPSDPNVDNTQNNGGDPVLGGPIKFTVTVDEWDELAEEEVSL